ncbi:hypothetical protein, partial [Salmonella sp. S146_54837]|uniref:hypothetical protein n=1 Tax=Salmonella sp. S146_54837 TaxID=2665635 RepID=UPI001CA7F821
SLQENEGKLFTVVASFVLHIDMKEQKGLGKYSFQIKLNNLINLEYLIIWKRSAFQYSLNDVVGYSDLGFLKHSRGRGNWVPGFCYSLSIAY